MQARRNACSAAHAQRAGVAGFIALQRAHCGHLGGRGRRTRASFDANEDRRTPPVEPGGRLDEVVGDDMALFVAGNVPGCEGRVEEVASVM